MKHHLRQEIEKLIKLLNRKRAELSDTHLHESLRNVYELSVLLQHQETFSERITSELGKKQAALFASLETESIVKEEPLPKEETHEEIPKLMDTIKNMVTEMPESQEVNELFTQIEEPNFVRKNPSPEKEEPTAIAEKQSPNLNERFNTGLKVDLNDRLAFIQHLFNNSPNDYQRAMNQLTTFNSFPEAANFIQNLIKPDYNQWEGKEEYEERFTRILALYFETK